MTKLPEVNAKVLVCGSRTWSNWKLLEERLSQLPEGTHIIEGGALGADMMAGQFATGRKWPLSVFPADWKKYGKAAGPIRNRLMLDEKPNLVIAFHHDLWASKGTKDCVEEAIRRCIPYEYVQGAAP